MALIYRFKSTFDFPSSFIPQPPREKPTGNTNRRREDEKGTISENQVLQISLVQRLQPGLLVIENAVAKYTGIGEVSTEDMDINGINIGGMEIEIDDRNCDKAITGRVQSSFNCSEAQWETYLRVGSDNTNLTAYWDEAINACGYGEVSMYGPLYGTLTTHVHPLFAAENWILEDFGTAEGMGSEAWKLLEPILQLATNFLLSKPSLAFFRKLRFGDKVWNVEAKRTYLQYDQPEDTSRQDDIVRQDLVKLAARLKLIFGVFSDPVTEQTGVQIHAAHFTSQELFGKTTFFRGDTSKLPTPEEDCHFMIVNASYKAYAETAKPTHCAFARYAFSLGFSLMHEIAHAFYLRDVNFHPEFYQEPYFSLDQHNAKDELGYALETEVFRDVINTFIDPKCGVKVQSEPVVKAMHGACMIAIEGHLVCPVDPYWIRQLLTQDFWDDANTKSGKSALEAFFVPRANQGLTLTHPERLENWGIRRAEMNRKRQKAEIMASIDDCGDRRKASRLLKKALLYLSSYTIIEDVESLEQRVLAKAVKKHAAQKAKEAEIEAITAAEIKTVGSKPNSIRDGDKRKRHDSKEPDVSSSASGSLSGEEDDLPILKKKRARR